ncbi:small integral membrane protein 8 isoform X1 [Perognathus longimembris pacificus]|uniref:small integral membrane protein 8 isoform X1 n=1 Tax=Perognathus longimembris pacificus TaxID=214514 RepID=UPI002019D751|nr:small integral membrane protein 8 isoform X1 [Perognathus longimembris pacificus]XP_048209820.1 small integral membrane protein 8 isoform X1 [Perognathus longimembris pacificus]XP_048209821.1 small integral membrane protein 8 isoform X1 [Perognathus longimembris pacificus]
MITLKMSKRPSDIPMGKGDKKKRKHLCLSIAQKVKLLEKLDSGVSVKHLTEEYGVGMTTVYDLKKQKDKLMKFYAESDEPKLMKDRKTLHKAKNEDLDRVLKEWIRQRRNEHMPLSGVLIMKQAKVYHNELKIEGNCEYSTGWLQKFKKRHGIKFLNIYRDKSSGPKAAEKFTEVLNSSESSVVQSLTKGEMDERAENRSDRGDSDGDSVSNTAGKVPLDDMVQLCDGLIEGLEQRAFITEQEVMSVYKIKGRLLRQKLLMRQMTLGKTFKSATQQNASSSLGDPLPGPSTAFDVS